MDGQKLNVAVVFGGRSGEHEVSLHSAVSVLGALDSEKYRPVPVLITREGKWLAGITPQAALAGKETGGIPVTPLIDPTLRSLLSLDTGKVVDKLGVVFPVLHGTYGEDGTIQGLLEMADVPYVGAGVLASSVGMDKVVMKRVFAMAGIPQAGFWSCRHHDWVSDRDEVIAEVENRFPYPVFIKPANLGSSVGISKAHARTQLIDAIDLALSYDRRLIIEEFIDAREVEVAVLGNDEPAVSLPGEIIPGNEFYDYEAKYVDGKSSLVIPAPLPAETVATLHDLALRVFRALDGTGLGRVDFFVRRDDGTVLVNEINTMPGFTRTSMYPKLWEATGVPYTALVDRLILLAVERHSERRRLRTTR